MEIAIAILALLGAAWAAVQLTRPERPREKDQPLAAHAPPPRRRARSR